jgi:hypothetical protein
MPEKPDDGLLPEKEDLKGAMSEKELAKDEKDMKRRILAEPKVPVMIPDDPINPGGAEYVSLNGVVFLVPKGKMVDVPKPIAEVIQDS